MSDDPAYRIGPGLALMRTLWGLDHALERASRQMVVRAGITLQQRLVIAIVGRYPSITPGQLARLLHVDAGTVSATVGRLEARRLLERRPHPKDRRRVTLGLTDAGHRTDVAGASPVEAAIERALARIEPADLESFRRVVAAVVEELAAADEPVV